MRARLSSRLTTLLSLALLGAGCASGGVAQTGSQPGSAASPVGDYVYVAIQGEAQVAVIDAGTLEEAARIDLRDLGFTENAKPHHIAVERDGSFWYLSLIGENRVLKFDGATNELVDQAEFQVPGMLAVHPTEDLLLVGRSMSAVNPPQRVGAISRSDMGVDEIDVFFPRPHAITVSTDGTLLYSASLALNQLAAVQLDSYDIELGEVEGPTHTLVQFAVSPDGSTLVGTGQLTGELLIFDLADPSRPALRDRVAIGRQPWHPVYARDRNVVYFGLKMDNAVVAVDTDSGQVLWRTEGGVNNPHGAGLSPDGRYLFVSSNGPGGMQMGGMEMGGDAGHDMAGHDMAGHDAGGHDMGEHDMAGHGEHGVTHPIPETGAVTVFDAATGELIKVLELGTNATGVGVRGQ